MNKEAAAQGMPPINQIIANQTSAGGASNQTSNASASGAAAVAAYCPDFSKILSANGGGSVGDLKNPDCSAF